MLVESAKVYVLQHGPELRSAATREVDVEKRLLFYVLYLFHLCLFHPVVQNTSATVTFSLSYLIPWPGAHDNVDVNARQLGLPSGDPEPKENVNNGAILQC